jgi:D-serine deaminase-like pyridoxal phosphate-dependent protein
MAPTTTRDSRRERYDRATAGLATPVAIVDLEAFDANADALTANAAGMPIRVASKSVRCRAALRRVLARPGWHGVLCYTLPEALWLVADGVTDDAVVGYPTVDRAAIERLAAVEGAAEKITIMLDDVAQLDLVDSVVPPSRRPSIRVCLELDASWKPGGLHVGVRRSPVHTARAAGELAATVAARPGFTLVGLMCYEAQIAGLGDRPAGQPVRGLLIRAIQRRSFAELTERRAAAVAAVRAHADLAFVNGGGTGSVAASAGDPALTEVAAGSGLYGPTLFDAYRAWRPRPAAFFAASVVRRPAPGVATVLGGGWVASGEAGRTRLPRPVLPRGLRLIGQEGAGEVQTPLVGPGAASLRIGDRVWFRHAKAGELCEHVNTLHVVDGSDVVSEWATYRGECQAFL